MSLKLNEDEMAAIVEACRVLRLLSKKGSVAEFVEYLIQKELVTKTNEGQLTWSKAEISLFNSIEKKFADRLKDNGLGHMIKNN